MQCGAKERAALAVSMPADKLAQRRRFMVVLSGVSMALVSVWAIVGVASKYRNWINVRAYARMLGHHGEVRRHVAFACTCR